MPLWSKFLTFGIAAVVPASFFAVSGGLGGPGVCTVIVATVVLATAAAHYLFVARPLRRILNGAQRFAAGDREWRIPARGHDDLARTARLLNSMVDHLGETRRGLESQVRERTADLRAVLAEVHERSRLAEEVNERLAESDQRRSKFLTNVSHDLRTPLNSILGYLKLLLDGVYENEAERREFLENARMSATHLLTLVQDVLTMTEVEEGMLKVRIEVVDPRELVSDVLRMLEVDRRERNLVLRGDVQGGIVVLADRSKVMQVLINLVGNAIKFTRSGDVVVSVHADGEIARFSVRDSGVGIPEHELEAIFERFHQVDGADAEWSGGTGLGLSICRDLVTRMGGEIRAHSDGTGKGSVFSFTLPCAAAPSEPAGPVPSVADLE